jgi:hypothetical protein
MEFPYAQSWRAPHDTARGRAGRQMGAEHDAMKPPTRKDVARWSP